MKKILYFAHIRIQRLVYWSLGICLIRLFWLLFMYLCVNSMCCMADVSLRCFNSYRFEWGNSKFESKLDSVYLCVILETTFKTVGQLSECYSIFCYNLSVGELFASQIILLFIITNSICIKSSNRIARSSINVSYTNSFTHTHAGTQTHKRHQIERNRTFIVSAGNTNSHRVSDSITIRFPVLFLIASNIIVIQSY